AYSPRVSVLTVLVAPVTTFVKETLVLGMALPEPSVMLPESAPPETCPEIRTGIATEATNNNRPANGVTTLVHLLRQNMTCTPTGDTSFLIRRRTDCVERKKARANSAECVAHPSTARSKEIPPLEQLLSTKV
ncbi:MAG: hypothetical protein ACRD1J_00335, partial [Terriglobia bacterium]